MGYDKEKEWLEEACDSLEKYYGKDCRELIFLISNNQAIKFRKQKIKELGAFEEQYMPVGGETIVGDKGVAVLLYPETIKTEPKPTDVETWFKHIVYHECTHAVFAQINREISIKQMHSGYRKRMQQGYTVIDEFIAESYANIIECAEPRKDCETVRKDLVKCLIPALPHVNGGKLYLASLGHYSAMLLTDPTILELSKQNPFFERGFDRCTKATADAIEDIIVWLNEYILADNNLNITEEQLDEIGKLTFRFINSMEQ